MSDDFNTSDARFKKFMREFYSPMQHWRLMKFIEYIKGFWNSWRDK